MALTMYNMDLESDSDAEEPTTTWVCHDYFNDNYLPANFDELCDEQLGRTNVGMIDDNLIPKWVMGML